MCNSEGSFVVCISFTMFIIFFLISLLTFILPLSEYYDYDLHKCNITTVLAPNTVPMIDKNLWDSCDCGRRCVSLKPCIKLYSSIDPKIMIKEKYYESKYEDCTFTYGNCENDLEYMISSLNESKKMALSYVNKTVDCYYNVNMDNIYLERSLDLVWGYTWLSITTLIFILFCIILLKVYIFTDNNNNKISNKEEADTDERYHDFKMKQFESHLV